MQQYTGLRRVCLRSPEDAKSVDLFPVQIEPEVRRCQRHAFLPWSCIQSWVPAAQAFRRILQWMPSPRSDSARRARDMLDEARDLSFGCFLLLPCTERKESVQRVAYAAIPAAAQSRMPRSMAAPINFIADSEESSGLAGENSQVTWFCNMCLRFLKLTEAALTPCKDR